MFTWLSDSIRINTLLLDSIHLFEWHRPANILVDPEQAKSGRKGGKKCMAREDDSSHSKAPLRRQAETLALWAAIYVAI